MSPTDTWRRRSRRFSNRSPARSRCRLSPCCWATARVSARSSPVMCGLAATVCCDRPCNSPTTTCAKGGRALATPWRRRLDAAPADRRGRALPGAGGDARWPPGGIAGAADVAGAARPGARAAGLAIPRGTAGEPGGGPLRTPRAARQFAQAGAVAGDDRRRLVALLGGAGTLRTGAGLARQPGVDRRVSSGAAGTPAGPAATGGRRRTRPAPACQPAQRPGVGPGPLPASAG